MNKRLFFKRFTTAAMVATMWILPIAAIGQTQVVAPKNKYKVQDDVREGAKAAAEIEKVFPVLNDREATAYVENVGRRLVRAIPQQFNQPAFNYRFQVVNASDINAFALPGGPMYVNRGMIEKARNEGEMAGVMAHEIGHVALRHATAQATEQGGIGKQLGMLGMILGGAILGGEAGAQLGMLGAAAWMTKFSRKYETQSDILGARIMADAGYDPRDLANMFRTIEGESKGSGGPEWLSSHPNPGNRFEAINREASLLRVSSNPIKITRDFERVQARLRAMPPAKTMAQLEKDAKNGVGGVENPTSSGRYSDRVAQPSSRTRNYAGISWVRVNVPQNWRDFASADDVQFAPEGA
ncbi:MAG: M48 family metallopeptidase, partial [Pyrinomonadaceae bacterium]